MSRVLYLSFDGLLQPLGYSQVARLLLELARCGHRYTVISLERSEDLSDAERVQALRARLVNAGVEWRPLTYAADGGSRAAMMNAAELGREAARVAQSGTISIIHARGYQAALVANLVRLRHGVPYIFDARGYWIDEVADEGRWFTQPLAYRAGKAVERRLYAQSSAVVTLTQLHANDLAEQALAGEDTPVKVITTVADFECFRPDADVSAVPEDVRERLDGRLVLGYVGSVNASYDVEASLRLASKVLRARDDATLLVLTRNGASFRPYLDRAQIPPDRAIVRGVAHEAMPAWLPLIDWGLLLLRSSFAKRASMPTKLGEFFGSGVRPIQHGCNPELSDWVRQTRSGLVLECLSDACLAEAARRIVEGSGGDPMGARDIAAPHFGLAAGAAAYDQLLADLARSSGEATFSPTRNAQPSLAGAT